MCNDTNLVPLFSYKKIADSFEMNLATLIIVKADSTLFK